MYTRHLFVAALALAAAIDVATGSVLSFNRTRWRAPNYLTSRSIAAGAINVHIQPHSHDDVG